LIALVPALRRVPGAKRPPTGPEDILPLRAGLADVERRTIRRALAACGGNRTRTAEALGISRRLLFDTIREYDL
jgi:two-component system response regulator AtoC